MAQIAGFRFDSGDELDFLAMNIYKAFRVLKEYVIQGSLDFTKRQKKTYTNESLAEFKSSVYTHPQRVFCLFRIFK